MNALDLLSTGWTWNPVAAAALIVGSALYAKLIGRRGRAGCFVAAMVLMVLAFFSPVATLAEGVLFSAHMMQHIVLLLLVPGLLWLSLPGAQEEPAMSNAAPAGAPVVIPWLLGVGSMWLWHVPQLCNAAATRPTVGALQAISLLAMGGAFWRPILSPRARERLIPGHGVAYLFTACLACSGLGILITISPVEVCPAFKSPAAAPAAWLQWREQLTFRRDQQIGGLMMWLPMCLIYVAGIVLELARWLGGAATNLSTRTSRP